MREETGSSTGEHFFLMGDEEERIKKATEHETLVRP